MPAAPPEIPAVHAVVLGVAQGLSEFLPISSSGHLILVPWALGWKELAAPANADLKKTFDVALHLGTFLGAAAYFRRDLAGLARAGLRSLLHRGARDPEEKLAWLLVVSAVPGALVGASLESVIEEKAGQIWLVAVMMATFGVVLVLADRARQARQVDDFRLRDAVVMGVCQAAALQPGVSRSGATISAARVLGFDRDAAARLSFLMSLPIIGGAGLFEGVEVLLRGGLPPGTGTAFALGMVSSAVTGLAGVWFVLRLVRTRSFVPFAVYRVAVGAAVLGALATRLR